MTMRRVMLELGAGNDLHGGDYTKAALRAVQDALHHSSLQFVHSLGLDPHQLRVEVTIGVDQPERVDTEAVRRSLPAGQITVRATRGGLTIPGDDTGGDAAVIASAAVAVSYDLP